MVEVELKSNELKTYVYLTLEKNRQEPLFDEDLNKIEDLALNGLDFINEPTDITLFDLVFFSNLKSCIISDKNISLQELNVLNSIKSLQTLQLIRCKLPQNAHLLSDIDYLILDKCADVKMDTYSNLKNIKKVKAINCTNFNLDGIQKCENLEKVYIQNMELENIDILLKLKKLRKINLNGTHVEKICKFNDNVELIHEDENFIYDNDD